MAKVTIVSCDKDQKPDAQSYSIILGGFRHTVDLCDSCFDELMEATAPWTSVGVETASSGSTATPRQRAAAEDRDYDPAVVRAFAKANNIPVSDKGRVSAEVVQKWRDANPATA